MNFIANKNEPENKNQAAQFFYFCRSKITGKVWTREELPRIGEICLKNDVIVVSDEIHCDLVYDGHTYIPFASISEEFRQNSVTCIAPTKTFSLAGIQVANIVAAGDGFIRINIACPHASCGRIEPHIQFTELQRLKIRFLFTLFTSDRCPVKVVHNM